MQKTVILSFSLLVLTIMGCKKEQNQSAITTKSAATSQTLAEPGVTGTSAAKESDACTRIYNLVKIAPNQYAATFHGVYIKITNPVYQVYCNDGTVIPAMDGVGAWGTIIQASPNGTVALQPDNYSAGGGQFVIVQGTGTSNWAGIQTGVNNFLDAWCVYTHGIACKDKWAPPLGEVVYTSYPDINSYLQPYVSANSGNIIITGKIVRSSTAASGFGITETCHPEVMTCPD